MTLQNQFLHTVLLATFRVLSGERSLLVVFCYSNRTVYGFALHKTKFTDALCQVMAGFHHIYLPTVFVANPFLSFML